MNRLSACQRVEAKPGGSGSLITNLPTSPGSHSVPSSLRVRTEKVGKVRCFQNLDDINVENEASYLN